MEIQPIKNDTDHAAALVEIEKLWGATENSEDGDKLDVLVTLVEKYEETRWPVVGISDNVELSEMVEPLIDWFISKNISPKGAALIMLRLLAEQMVVANKDREVLQKALNETIKYLATEVVDCLQRRWKEAQEAGKD